MNTRHRHTGFSLIELITVVLILGILAGIAAPKMMRGSDEAAIEATISHLKTMALACEMHFNELGNWPADSVTGEIPPTLGEFLRPNLFAVATPIGGGYDWDVGTAVADKAIKVVDSTPSLETWRSIDQRIDDGVDDTGNVRITNSGGRWHLSWLLSD